MDTRFLDLAPDWHPLNWIDEYLQVRGWTNDGHGWNPPETIREAIEIQHGRGGHWRRQHAIGFQVEFDQLTLPHSTA